MAKSGNRSSASQASGAKGEAAAAGVSPGPLDALSAAIESGAGLPTVTRAAAEALDAGIALIDRSSAVLAVAASSGAEEERLVTNGSGVERAELRVADAVVGELRFRLREGGASPASMRMVSTLLALEVERARSPVWADDEEVAEFVRAVCSRELQEPGEIVRRGAELGAELSEGGGAVIARAVPRRTQSGDWRARLLALVTRSVGPGGSGALAALLKPDRGDVIVILPGVEEEGIARAAAAIEEELRRSLAGVTVTIGTSRPAADAAELYRAGKEALMATNVAETEGGSPLSFEQTGAYRLLLPAMSDDPAELQRFFDETIAPLAAYDDQYETELVATVEAYLDNDGNVTPTAETLFTHRHTVRYRLERVRELCGHDLNSTEGRERIGLGLKAMRVLGIAAPSGPAREARTKRNSKGKRGGSSGGRT